MKNNTKIMILFTSILAVVLLITAFIPSIRGNVIMLVLLVSFRAVYAGLIPEFNINAEDDEDNKDSHYTILNYIKSYFYGLDYCAWLCSPTLFMLAKIISTIGISSLLLSMSWNIFINPIVRSITVILVGLLLSVPSIKLMLRPAEDSKDRLTGIICLSITMLIAVVIIVLPTFTRFQFALISVWLFVICWLISYELNVFNVTNTLALVAPLAFIPWVGALFLAGALREDSYARGNKYDLL